VSPFGPSFLPPASVFSAESNFCCPLESLTLTGSYYCKLFVAPKKLNSFTIKQIQTLSAKHPAYGVPQRHLSVLCASLPNLSRAARGVSKGALSSLIDFLTLCFHNLTNPFSRNSFRCTSIQNPEGWRELPSSKSNVPTFERANLFSPLFPFESHASRTTSHEFLFTLDFAPRTKYCSTANCCSLERGL